MAMCPIYVTTIAPTDDPEAAETFGLMFDALNSPVVKRWQETGAHVTESDAMSMTIEVDGRAYVIRMTAS